MGVVHDVGVGPQDGAAGEVDGGRAPPHTHAVMDFGKKGWRGSGLPTPPFFGTRRTSRPLEPLAPGGGSPQLALYGTEGGEPHPHDPGLRRPSRWLGIQRDTQMVSHPPFPPPFTPVGSDWLRENRPGKSPSWGATVRQPRAGYRLLNHSSLPISSLRFRNFGRATQEEPADIMGHHEVPLGQRDPRRRPRGRRGAGARSCPRSPATPCRPHLDHGGKSGSGVVE